MKKVFNGTGEDILFSSLFLNTKLYSFNFMFDEKDPFIIDLPTSSNNLGRVLLQTWKKKRVLPIPISFWFFFGGIIIQVTNKASLKTNHLHSFSILVFECCMIYFVWIIAFVLCAGTVWLLQQHKICIEELQKLKSMIEDLHRSTFMQNMTESLQFEF